MTTFVRAIIIFAIVAGISVLAWQLADEPGSVSLAWHGWRIDTSASLLAVLLLVVLGIGALVYAVWHGLRVLPRRLAQTRERRRREAGYHALTQGMVAIAAGDAAEARRHAKRASELLGRPPGALLIGAQAAQLEGQPEQARQFYRAMVESKETELLGLRGLLGLAEQDGDRAQAMELAARAHALAPKTPWVLTRLFHLQIAARQWEAAERTLREAIAARAVGEGEGKRSDAVLLVQLSLMAERTGDRTLAIERARRALGLDDTLLPASLQLAALFLADNQLRRARKVIGAAWRRQPHPDLARLFALASGETDPVKRYRALAVLEADAPAHPETHRALARAALEAMLWGEARRHLKAGGGAAPDAGFCRLMAELEQSETGNTAVARDWLGRTSEADPEPAWLCRAGGAAAREWSALCGNCGGFDTFAWGQPPRVTALAGGLASGPGGAASGTIIAATDAATAPIAAPSPDAVHATVPGIVTGLPADRALVAALPAGPRPAA